VRARGDAVRGCLQLVKEEQARPVRTRAREERCEGAL